MASRAYQSNRIPEEHKELMRKFIKDNPESPFSEFHKKLGSKIKCSDAHYYSVKRSIFGPSKPAPRAYNRNPNAVPRKASTLYLTFWSCPAEKMTAETREVFKEFLEAMNNNRKSRFSMIELKDPAIIEVRESHVRA